MPTDPRLAGSSAVIPRTYVLDSSQNITTALILVRRG